jgi:hypothetical protein
VERCSCLDPMQCEVRGMGFDIMAFLGYSGAIWCMAYVLASWNF